MRIKLDENLPLVLVTILAAMDHDVHSVRDEGLIVSPDSKIWTSAQADTRFLVTQDLDFSNIRQFVPGTHHGILLVRLRNPDRRELTEKVTSLFRHERIDQWAGCFVAATDRKLRVIRPAESP